MRSYPLGIDLPQGADIRELPAGLTDYIRPDSKASAVRMQSHPAPIGRDVPIQHTWSAYDGQARPARVTASPAHMRSYPLGIDLPQGADIRELPTGLTDYIRPDSKASAVPMRSYPLGIDPPCGVDLRELPTGLTDYFRPQSATVCTQ